MIRRLLTLTLLMLTICISLPTNQANAESEAAIKQRIVHHSLEMGIDPALGLSIAKQESGFCHAKKSSYGAVGVFQLMPQTAKRLGYNPYYLNENIRAGLMYYKMMYRMFGSTELALAAYNAGPASVKKYGGVPPYSETRKFVANIMNEYNYQKKNPDSVIRQHHNSKSRTATSQSTFRHQLDRDGIITNFMLNQAI